MEEQVLRPTLGGDEAEAAIAQAFDSSGCHDALLSARLPSRGACRMIIRGAHLALRYDSIITGVIQQLQCRGLEGVEGGDERSLVGAKGISGPTS
jgi:hypothetical protein